MRWRRMHTNEGKEDRNGINSANIFALSIINLHKGRGLTLRNKDIWLSKILIFVIK